MAETFLLEIGVEELPARFCADALEQLRQRGEASLRAERLPFVACRVYGTPRRLAWYVEGVAERQEDKEVVVRGPARAVAFDAQGRPTAAAVGFARAQDVAVDDLVVEASGGREYVVARRRQAGRPAAEVLADLVPPLVASLAFPRAMRWGDGDFRFARPIRWLVALLGTAVVPCEVAGLRADRVTYGHRALHRGPLALRSAEDYVRALRGAGVLVDRAERRARIEAGAREVARDAGGRPRLHGELLDEVTDLNEWPTPFLGGFDPGALELPEAVLVTVMRVHQRYFPVEDGRGALLPHFVCVRNGGDRGLETVRAGNERVLAARFADARFFYEQDLSEPLAARVPRLDSVTFAEGLGTLADKARRLRALALALARRVGADDAALAALDRAAELCKADRLTHLVYELPELEGTMGAHYAERAGEPEAVVAAIAEHVLPRASGDALPQGLPGRVLALADRLDTLAGHFLLGRRPSGSADPYGLRRAGAAVIRILEDARWDLSLAESAAAAASGYGDPDAETGPLAEFLRGRLQARLEELGYRHDIVEAVLAAGADRVADAVARCAALTQALRADGWADTVTAFKRAGHLARQGGAAGEVDPARLRHPTERALWEALCTARAAAADALAAGDHAAVLAATGSLRQPVDAFLTEVLAMDPDPEVRRNRLALLAGVAAVPAPVADLERLQGGDPAR